jgi:citrate lyase subunit gamma (acyl carrier protein)
LKVLHDAACGSLESSDVYVTVKPGAEGIQITIESIVKKRYGKRIEQVAREVLERLRVSRAQVFIQDQGAVDFVIRARLETALARAGEEEQ